MTTDATTSTDTSRHPEPEIRLAGGVGRWIERHAAQRPDSDALRLHGERLSYSELDSRVNRLASALRDRRIGKGDRVGAVLLNSFAFLETLFACAKLGAIFVPVNFRLSPEEVEFILTDSGSRILVYHPCFHALIEPGRARTHLEHALCVSDATSSGPGIAGDADYEETLRTGADTRIETVIHLDDPHLMMYTSGTTGRPKGAVLSHGNTTWNAVNALLSDLGLQDDDRILTVAPLFHIGGLNSPTLPAMYRGVPVVLQAAYDPVELLAELERERITVLFLVPAMWQALTQVPEFDDYDLSALRSLISGGAPCPIPAIEFFQNRGLRFQEGFGLTETAAGVCILGNEDAVRKNGSVGKPLMHVQMRIVDDNDHDVAPGEVGELLVRGPNVFLGYWNRPEASAEALRDGWFHTGDLACQDDEGFYYIVDRKKDMLISGGENVYPTEVEQVLYRHPKIREVAVIGVPDERWGEVPVAIVAPEGDAPTLEDIHDYCSDRLARFKTPKDLIIVAALPRNATGKVLKRELRQEYARSRD